MKIDQILDDFGLLDSWDDRYRYVIELGRMLSPLSERDRTNPSLADLVTRLRG